MEEGKKEVSTGAIDALRFIVEGINDRDAPSLYGLVPERDLFALWSDKVDLTDSASELEPDLFASHAADRLVDELGIAGKARSLVFVENTTMPFLRAIVDVGLFEKRAKVIARVVSQDAEGFRKAGANHLPVRAGRVPERNWIELQHQMWVCNTAQALFVSTFSGGFRVVTVKRDDVFASNHVAECILFWDYVRRGTPPPNAIIPPDVDPDSDEAAGEAPLFQVTEENLAPESAS